jgi:hypothetical protein
MPFPPVFLIFLFLGLKNKEKSLCVAEAFGQKAQGGMRPKGGRTQ